MIGRERVEGKDVVLGLFEEWLDPSVLAGYRAADVQIIATGNHDNPPGTIPTGKRGVIK